MTLPQYPGGLPPDDHFPRILDELESRSWSVVSGFLDQSQWLPLFQRSREIDAYRKAAVGRGGKRQRNRFVRTDGIHWLEAGHPVDRTWLAVMESLRLAVNRAFFLGLFDFECHYARYPKGSFYRRHTDAFKGEGNRVVSTVLYLNPNWQPGEGGELVLYPEESDAGLRFLPQGGDLAVFLSEEIPHEVLTANRTRYSIAGWFRVNGSTGGRADPAN